VTVADDQSEIQLVAGGKTRFPEAQEATVIRVSEARFQGLVADVTWSQFGFGTLPFLFPPTSHSWLDTNV
jgi:hypothetical protein